jgi:hypothetical protein
VLIRKIAPRLRRPNKSKQMKINESNFAFIYFFESRLFKGLQSIQMKNNLVSFSGRIRFARQGCKAPREAIVSFLLQPRESGRDLTIPNE